MLQTVRPERFLYEEIADSLIQLIRSRTLRPGHKLPSVRRMSQHKRVSISTVLQAYLRLEAQGYIEARPQSGYYVLARPSERIPEPRISRCLITAPSAEVNVDAFISEIIDSIRDPEMVPLGGSSIHTDWLPTRRLYNYLAAAAKHATTNTYESPRGNAELRRQIAARTVDSTWPVNADDLIITCGCLEAINLALRAVAKPGDTIAIESPTYFGMLQAIEGLGLKVLEIPTHPRTGMDLDALETALEHHTIAACLTIPTFHNPLGACMPLAHKRRLLAMMTARNIPIIEDDIYGEFYFDSAPPPTLKSMDDSGLVLLCSSFSKSLSPGFRVGWIAPGRFYDKVLRLKRTSTMGTSALPQVALADFLASGHFERHLRRLRGRLQQQMETTLAAVERYFPLGTRVSRPEGGFVLWVEFPPQVDTIKLYRQAQERSISIVPGPVFSPRLAFRNCIRLNCGSPWDERLENAIQVLGQLAAQHCV